MGSSWSRALLTGVPVSAVLLAGCDSAAPEPISSPSGKPAGSPTATAEGTVLLQLEQIQGMLIEGFQLKVRLEAPPGHQVLSSTWLDLLHRQKPKPEKIDFYGTVIPTSVPAGPFVLETVMHPGMEPAQPTCVSRGLVEPGGFATVTVKFQNEGGCSTVTNSGPVRPLGSPTGS
jgi:hypothetical protein